MCRSSQISESIAGRAFQFRIPTSAFRILLYALGAGDHLLFVDVMKPPWVFRILLPLVMLILLAVSCDRILRNLRNDSEGATVQPVDETLPEETAAPQDTSLTGDGRELINNEKGIEITLPESWAENPQLHTSAELQAAEASKDLYVIVVAEDSPALMLSGLQENAARYRALLKDQMATFEGENPTEVAFINDNFASQYEIRGSLAGGIPVVYLHTTVATQQRYYQIVAWTTPDQYEAYRSELQTITETFREIDS